MLAAPRPKAVRKAQKVFLVDLVEDGDHGLLDKSYPPGPRLPTDVAVHLLSVCTLFSKAALDTLHDELGCGDRRVGSPSRTHTPATLLRPLPAQLFSSTSKSSPGVDRRSDGGARR